jgi:hypothetical protein
MAPKNDVPLPLALVLLTAIIALLAVDGSGDIASGILNRAQVELGQHADVYGILATCLVFNSGVAYIFLSRAFSYRRQGSRLKDLTGERAANAKSLWATAFGALKVGFGIACVLVPLPFLLDSDSSPSLKAIWSGVAFNVSFTAGVVLFGSTQFIKRVFSTRRSANALPEFPTGDRAVVVGAINEENAADKASWLLMNERALNGNILVTGSIGSGKTQGTILPYFEQLLSQFKPHPAVLAIDPKGTFVREALEIAKLHGLSDCVRHLRLGGDVRFNPIYEEGCLKNSRFLDIAQMIRAASVNFSGKSTGDSPFWEISAFNLTKNALVFCAAVHGYYTLHDLYTAMMDAVDDRVSERLEEALRSEVFGTEEKFNIRQALAYFTQEFANFDSKVKTGILATATAFLNQFQEYQSSAIFCPKKEDITLHSLDEVVDNGLILLFDVVSSGLARAMGTFVKLHFQQSVLSRLTNGRPKDRSALLLIDEYQDVVSSGYGALLGDDRFLAKGREAKAITIAATQSLSSLENSLGRELAARELCQNFRTRIACHSADLLTIRTFQTLAGEEDKSKSSHSFSELSQDTRKNHFTGAFEAENANITESVSTSLAREALVTGKDFSRLNAFEAFGLVYDGLTTSFQKIFLKPYFLKEKTTPHARLLATLASAILGLVFLGPIRQANAFPNVCDVVKTPGFSSCLQYSVSTCMCGWPSHPCAHVSYFVPDTFIEVVNEKGATAFRDLPGAAAQLESVQKKGLPYGTEGNDFASFDSHTLPVPLTSLVGEALPCDESTPETTCFGAMSEHLGMSWSTGLPDAKQPNHLLWALNPKACLLLGAAQSIAGGEAIESRGQASCSVNREALTLFPPSSHSACTGWGVFYPRVGQYDGPSQTTAALMIAARMKSLSTEVFQSASASVSEKWQMIKPSASQCFREGQNVLLTEKVAFATDWGRLAGGGFKTYLFTTWRRVSCCKEYTSVATGAAALAGLQVACQGLGGVR